MTPVQHITRHAVIVVSPPVQSDDPTALPRASVCALSRQLAAHTCVDGVERPLELVLVATCLAWAWSSKALGMHGHVHVQQTCGGAQLRLWRHGQMLSMGGLTAYLCAADMRNGAAHWQGTYVSLGMCRSLADWRNLLIVVGIIGGVVVGNSMFTTMSTAQTSRKRSAALRELEKER
eukprot:358723-Chlamydomonas_euryale.AAC.3